MCFYGVLIDVCVIVYVDCGGLCCVLNIVMCVFFVLFVFVLCCVFERVV